MRTGNMAKRVLVAVLLVAVTTVGASFVAGPAQAQSASCNLPAQYQGSATFSANVTTAAPGSTIVYTGTGWPPNSTVTISINGTVVGSAQTDASGKFTFSYTVPANATGTITASAGCGSFSISNNVLVTGGGTNTGNQNTGNQSTTTGGTTLPTTGSDAAGLAQVALLLLAVGGLFVLLARRRSTAES